MTMMSRKPKQGKSLARSGSTRAPYAKVFIVCEGEKTEPNYFNELKSYYKINSANIVITGLREMNIYLVCDESGAKGYSSQKEQYSGEVGIFAGLLITDHQLEAFDLKMQELVKNHTSNMSKRHIADLPSDKAQKLRKDVFQAIKNYKLVCLYEAIHVQGFYCEANRIREVAKNARQNSRSCIRINSHEKPESLHDVLFEGLFLKALAWCIEQREKQAHLTIMMDHVDAAIAKRMQSAAQAAIDFSPQETPVKGFDMQIRRPVFSSIKIELDVPKSYGFDEFGSASFTLNVLDRNEPILLAADIVANSLNHHFKQRRGDKIGRPVCSREAICGHALSECFWGFMDHKDDYWMSDIVYMHPLNKSFAN